MTNAPATGRPAPIAPLASVSAQVTATVGGVTAPVGFSGLAPNFAGLYQVNISIPAGVSTGSPVVLMVGGATSKPASLP